MAMLKSVLQNIHRMSVLSNEQSVERIDPLPRTLNAQDMTSTPPTTLLPPITFAHFARRTAQAWTLDRSPS
jgi:hypothetical protein